jgi:hypothetical protein
MNIEKNTYNHKRLTNDRLEQIKNEWRGYSDESERGAVAT